MVLPFAFAIQRSSMFYFNNYFAETRLEIDCWQARFCLVKYYSISRYVCKGYNAFHLQYNYIFSLNHEFYNKKPVILLYCISPIFYILQQFCVLGLTVYSAFSLVYLCVWAFLGEIEPGR